MYSTDSDSDIEGFEQDMDEVASAFLVRIMRLEVNYWWRSGLLYYVAMLLQKCRRMASVEYKSASSYSGIARADA